MKKEIVLSILSVAFILYGCAFDYYLPATQSVPLFTQKGDLKTLVSASLDKSNYTGEVQCAYSMLNHLSITAAFTGMGSKEDEKFNQPNGVAFDAGVGYYKLFGESIVFETYGGIGAFSQYRQYNTHYAGIKYDNISDVNAMNLFIQPNLGYVAPNFEFAFSTRVVQLSFTKVDNRAAPGTEEYYRLRQIARGENFVLIEPALTLRGGGENKKAQLQIVTTFPEKFDGRRLFDFFHLSLSFILVFPKGSSGVDKQSHLTLK